MLIKNTRVASVSVAPPCQAFCATLACVHDSALGLQQVVVVGAVLRKECCRTQACMGWQQSGGVQGGEGSCAFMCMAENMARGRKLMCVPP